MEFGFGGLGPCGVLDFPGVGRRALGGDVRSHVDRRLFGRIDLVVPFGARDVRRRGDVAFVHRPHGVVEARATVSVLDVPLGSGQPGEAAGAWRSFDRAGGRAGDLEDLVGVERFADLFRRRGILARRGDQRSDAGRSGDRGRGRAVGGWHAEQRVRAVGGERRARAEGRRGRIRRQGGAIAVRLVGDHGVAGPDVWEAHALGVVGGLEVVRGPCDDDAVLVRVFDRTQHRRCLSERGRGHVDHLGSGFDGEHDSLGHAIGPVDRLVAHLHRQQPASGAHADAAEFVVRGGDQRLLLAVGMVVDRVVGLGVVRVAMEVPSRDVIWVAVFVVVELAARRALSEQVVFDLAVAEGDDQVLRRDAAGLRVGPADAGIVHVVLDIEDAVAVEIVGAVGVPFAILGIRQLSGVEVGLVAQIVGVRELPVDAPLHVGDGHVAHAVGGPRAIGAHARGAFAIARARRRLRDAVEQRPLLRVPCFRAGEVALGACVTGVVGAAYFIRARRGGGGVRSGEHDQQREQRCQPDHTRDVGPRSPDAPVPGDARAVTRACADSNKLVGLL